MLKVLLSTNPLHFLPLLAFSGPPDPVPALFFPLFPIESVVDHLWAALPSHCAVACCPC